MKPLYNQATEAIGKQYGRQHASQTTKAIMSAVRQFTGFLKSTYGLQRIENVKPHMVEKFLAMRSEVVGSAQLTRDATAVRLVADAVGKSNIVGTNKSYGIERTTADRMQPVQANHDKLEEVRSALAEKAERTGSAEDKALVASFDIRSTFGLRANEGLMSRVENGSEGLKLIVGGAKGGRPRELTAETPEQRQALERQVAVSKEIGNEHGRLIPPELTAKQMYDYQKNTMSALGATKANNAQMHAVRHSYVQKEVLNGTDKQELALKVGHFRESSIGHYDTAK